MKEEGPIQKQTQVLEDKEEILPDGTVHHIHKVRQHSLRKTKKSWKSAEGDELVIDESVIEVPGTVKEDCTETYAEPPRMMREEKSMEEVLQDGTKIQRNIVMNRMVSKIRTRQESFDENKGHREETFEIDEIIPGTESAFIAGQDSSSSSYTSGSYLSEGEEDDDTLDYTVQADMDEKKELKDDGSSVTDRLLTAQQTRTVRSRSGSIEETETQITVTEHEISPSPRPRSPVDNMYDVEDLPTVQESKMHMHLEEVKRDDTVERTLDVVEDMLSRGALGAPEERMPIQGAESRVGSEQSADTIEQGNHSNTWFCLTPSTLN